VKVILRNYGIRMSSEERQVARAQASDMVRTRGTGKVPGPPRDVFLQSGPRGLLVNWRMPAGLTSDIAGFRIYKDNEGALFAEIRDPSTTQHFIETTAGSTPPTANIFVSSINKLNVESSLVQAQGSALVEAGAPSMPSTPPSYQGSHGCPLSGAPVRLYGDPAWWSKRIVPCQEFFRITTDKGREGIFSRDHRMFCRRGLKGLFDWHIGDFALTEDGEECVGLIEAVTIPDGLVDRYEASEGHIFSAWGFISHNIKNFGGNG
jgi:hypothetical protein